MASKRIPVADRLISWSESCVENILIASKGGILTLVEGFPEQLFRVGISFLFIVHKAYIKIWVLA